MPEGWLPFLRRQYDTLRSYAPPPPPVLPPKPAPVTSWQDLYRNIQKSGVLTPWESIKKNTEKWWNEPVDPAKPSVATRAMGTFQGLATDVPSRMATTMMDVTDPRNTGSERKPMKDVFWEGAKAVKEAYTKPTAPKQMLGDAIASRLPEAQDPISAATLKFILNMGGDLSNLGGGSGVLKGLGAAVGGGMDAASIPMWLWKKQKNIEAFSHRANQASDIPAMVDTGFMGKTSSDVLDRHLHVAGISPEEVEVARRAGQVPKQSSHPSYEYGPQMPVQVGPNVEVLELTEPVPKEDVQAIVDRMHPDKDRNLISDIWDAWREQKDYVVPREKQISGEVPFKSIKDSPAHRAVKKLEELLIDPKDIHTPQGVRIYGSPLNHPMMPTEPWQAISHRDIVAGGKPESLALDPRVALVSTEKETVPYKTLGTYGNETFPVDYPTNQPPVSIRPSTKTAPPVPPPSSNFPSVIAAQQKKAPPPPPQSSPLELEPIETHISDLKDIAGDYGLDLDILLSKPNPNWTPEYVHKFAGDYFKSIGADSAADEVADLWKTKLAEGNKLAGPSDPSFGGLQQKIHDQNVDDFSANIYQNDELGLEDIVQEWAKLDPNEQLAYSKKYPLEYDGIIGSHAYGSWINQLGKVEPPIYGTGKSIHEPYAKKEAGASIPSDDDTYAAVEDFHQNIMQDYDIQTHQIVDAFNKLPASVQEMYGAVHPDHYDSIKVHPNYNPPVKSPIQKEAEAWATGNISATDKSQKIDVYNTKGGVTIKSFDTQAEADDWINKQPNAAELDSAWYDPAFDPDVNTSLAPPMPKVPLKTPQLPVVEPPKSTEMIFTPEELKAFEDISGGGDFQLKQKNAPLAGIHKKHLYSKGGQDYIFKPTSGPDFVPHMENSANKVANLAGLHPIEMTVENIGGQTGTMQAVIGNKTDWPSLRSPGQSIEKLTTSQLQDIIKNQPVDWLTANHDAHRGQWLITPQGIIEVDRGQAFKHFGEDSLEKTYNPNAKFGEEPSIYIGIHKLWKEGKLPQLTDKDINQALSQTIERIYQKPNDVIQTLQDALERSGKIGSMPTMQSRFNNLYPDLVGFWKK